MKHPNFDILINSIRNARMDHLEDFLTHINKVLFDNLKSDSPLSWFDVRCGTYHLESKEFLLDFLKSLGFPVKFAYNLNYGMVIRFDYLESDDPRIKVTLEDMRKRQELKEKELELN